VRTKVTTASPKVRELFIEELAEIHAGAPSGGDPCCTTMACCEEGPFGCCHIIDPGDIIDPKP
jgi:hypothetical protein